MVALVSRVVLLEYNQVAVMNLLAKTRELRLFDDVRKREELEILNQQIVQRCIYGRRRIDENNNHINSNFSS